MTIKTYSECNIKKKKIEFSFIQKVGPDSDQNVSQMKIFIVSQVSTYVVGLHLTVY